MLAERRVPRFELSNTVDSGGSLSVRPSPVEGSYLAYAQRRSGVSPVGAFQDPQWNKPVRLVRYDLVPGSHIASPTLEASLSESLYHVQ